MGSQQAQPGTLVGGTGTTAGAYPYMPALVERGRGNTILIEIADAVGRMAQPDTVETLAAMHWHASPQAGQRHKILRTVAGIRNPPALRALLRLAERSESPALAAAEALQNLKQTEGSL